MSGNQVFHGGTFHGPVINQLNAERIENSFHTFNASAAPTELKDAIGTLHDNVQQLSARLAAQGADPDEVISDLENFTTQAAAPKPSPKILQVTGQGLIDAAKNVAELVAPITTTVNFVLKLMGLPSI